MENIQISKWDWPNKIVLINNIVRMLTTSVRVLHVCLAQCTCLDCQGLESTKDKKGDIAFIAMWYVTLCEIDIYGCCQCETSSRSCSLRDMSAFTKVQKQV